jgi:hypothetical protein
MIDLGQGIKATGIASTVKLNDGGSFALPLMI